MKPEKKPIAIFTLIAYTYAGDPLPTDEDVETLVEYGRGCADVVKAELEILGPTKRSFK